MIAPKNEEGNWGENWTPADGDKSYMEGIEKMLFLERMISLWIPLLSKNTLRI